MVSQSMEIQGTCRLDYISYSLEKYFGNREGHCGLKIKEIHKLISPFKSACVPKRWIARNSELYHWLVNTKGCLVCIFKQPFSVFKQHFRYFHTFFHPHVFPPMFLNNNFQVLNTCIKRILNSPDLQEETYFL